MKPIKVIDAGFDFLGEIDAYRSLKWTRRWHKPGEFEVRMEPRMQGVQGPGILQEGNIVFLDPSSGEAGIIQHVEVNLSPQGVKELVVRGQTLAGILGRRITYPPPGKAYDYRHAEVETIMKAWV